MNTPVRSILIVGGGSAGWITAGTLAAAHQSNQPDGLNVTVIESSNVPTIGVGEGTWPTMRSTLQRMGVSETDFMRNCDAAFKQGACFAKWVTGAENDAYYHPLVLPQGFLKGNLVPDWLENDQGRSFADAVCPQEAVCEHGLAPKQITTPEYGGVLNYAYHLDAGKFADFIRTHCIENLGVRHIVDDVTGVNAADNGDIASLSTTKSGDLEADLFVDCTGFRSLLLGDHYGVGFKSCKDTLFIDTALAVQVPYPSPDSPVATHTISTGQSAGWIWDIGLPTRCGIGHVYSSAHTSEEDAARQLDTYIQAKGASLDDLGYRKIAINPGHREKFWQNNCVAIGLSAGFLEPLEASALVLIELASKMLADQMPANRAAMDVVARRFNDKFNYRWDRIIDFLKLHYILNRRDGEAFWDDNRREETIPDSLHELMTLWAHQPPFHDDFDHKDEVFPSASYQYVLYGMGFKTAPSPIEASSDHRAFAAAQFAENRKTAAMMTSQLPQHRILLNKVRDYGFQTI